MKLDSSRAVYEGMKEAGIDFAVSVPCVNLRFVLEMVDSDPEIRHVPVTREEEGFGVAAGAYMAGKTTAMLMQNSGLGNSVNVLASLYSLYHIPITMIVSHRGTRGEFMEAQVPMGRATTEILDVLKIPYSTPETPPQARESIVELTALSLKKRHPVAVLLEVAYW
ncbi:sulfopyruvate decarboxylase subunit alpha [Methanothermobacter sp.]|uniref:sulfopyruvate decarboxylase subunit alpha n=1 Tax=Methanothermobacter sp. TaxID=1884223 RepID=UPI00261AFEEF|nr:sulfopyruvate decarboxylase subunit alpha [Methanothermobacter sp.]MDI9618513.1 sulfopyruvate decarboxylase subunit alpha [Methanothermobacter sp.]